MEEKELVGAELTAADTLIGDLTTTLLDAVKAMPEPWQKMSEAAQTEWLERWDRQVIQAARRATFTIAAQNHIYGAAEVDSVTFKDGVKVVLKFQGVPGIAHDIADVAGDMVVISIPETIHLKGEEGKPTAEPDHYEMDLGDDHG